MADKPPRSDLAFRVKSSYSAAWRERWPRPASRNLTSGVALFISNGQILHTTRTQNNLGKKKIFLQVIKKEKKNVTSKTSFHHFLLYLLKISAVKTLTIVLIF